MGEYYVFLDIAMLGRAGYSQEGQQCRWFCFVVTSGVKAMWEWEHLVISCINIRICKDLKAKGYEYAQRIWEWWAGRKQGKVQWKLGRVLVEDEAGERKSGSLSFQHVALGMRLSHLAWWQVPFPTEPSHQLEKLSVKLNAGPFCHLPNVWGIVENLRSYLWIVSCTWAPVCSVCRKNLLYCLAYQ